MSNLFKIVKPNLGLISKLPNPGLHSFLNNNENGVIQDIRTPLFNKAPREQIISEWLNIINQSSNKLLLEQVNDEYDQSHKIGRFSAMFPFSERFESVKSYYTNAQFSFNEIYNDIVDVGTNNYLKQFNKYKSTIRLQTPNKVSRDIPLSTNSGLPEFIKRSLALEDSLNRINSHIYSTPSSLDDYLSSMNCVLGWRGQQVDKQRVVWMFPLDLNIIESMYYKPFIKLIQNCKLKPEFISQELVEQNITRLFDTSQGQLIVATDFDMFDAHFNSKLQDLAFDCKLFFVNKEVDRNFIMASHYRKFDIPILCTHDIMFTGHHGMSSGSTGTNMDENYSHGIMQHCAAVANGSVLNPYSSVLGDDGVLSYPGITVDNVAQVYSSIFGQKINQSKQTVSKIYTKYLQRMYHKHYRNKQGTILGVYPTMRALGRLLAQERYYDPAIWNSDMVVLRSLSIIENCNRHPLFNDFIEFVLNGDKYKLGINIPGFFDKYGRLNEEKLYSMLPGSISYSRLQNSSTRLNGISNWKVFRYLVNKLNKR